MNNSHMDLDHEIPNLPPHEEEEDEEENGEDSASEDPDDGDEEEHDDPNEEEEEDNELSIPISSALHHQNQNHLGVNLSESGRNGGVAGGGGKHLARAATAATAIGDAPSPGGGGGKTGGTPSKRMKMMAEDEDAGTPEEQAEFLNEVETFYKERALEFKAPKFYGEPLNCLKLWNAVVRLGGYDRSPPSWTLRTNSICRTCTTVSWTFRIFYEKALLEYEKHKRQIGELEFPGFPLTEPAAAENEGSGSQNAGSGRARRDAAARAMQSWHAQRLIGFGEVGEPIIKDKNLGASQKREKNLKSIGLNKLKKPSNLELGESDLHTEQTKQLLTTVVDVGPPADWVKVSVRESKDCFEVYALVPGLLREEVRVQSDPAGRIVITGQPEQLENPWGITPFRKVVNLPARINPLQTSAVVSLHGRLFIRVPFERSST
ncbi:AT-rich interactive domain-containing protein [Drosera capensis]